MDSPNRRDTLKSPSKRAERRHRSGRGHSENSHGRPVAQCDILACDRKLAMVLGMGTLSFGSRTKGHKYEDCVRTQVINFHFFKLCIQN